MKDRGKFSDFQNREIAKARAQGERLGHDRGIERPGTDPEKSRVIEYDLAGNRFDTPEHEAYVKQMAAASLEASRRLAVQAGKKGQPKSPEEQAQDRRDALARERGRLKEDLVEQNKLRPGVYRDPAETQRIQAEIDRITDELGDRPKTFGQRIESLLKWLSGAA